MRFAGLLLLLLCGAIAARAEAPAPRSTVIVVDSSGSMAAALEGATRLDAARAVLGELLAGWPAGAPLALVAYGHRRTGDCADIEVLAPPGPPDPAALTKRLQDLRARGKTPLAASLQLAGTLLPPAGGEAGASGNIILLTDGLETCAADPCAMAGALRTAGVTVHVVGFGVTEAEGRELACIAEAGGGLYRGAADAGALLDSLDAVAEVALAEPAPAPAPAPVPSPPPAPLPQQVGFVAVYAGGGRALDLPVDWSVAATGATPAFAYQGGGRGLALTLEPGSYRVTARVGNASAAQNFAVADEALTVEVPLAVGQLQASVVPARGQPPLGERDGLRWTLVPLEGQGDPGPLAGAAPDLLLAAGRYRLAVVQDLWQAAAEIEILVGSTTTQVLSLGLGGLTLEAALEPEGPALEAWQGLHWTVLDDGGAPLVERAQQARPRFLLPAGEWTLRLALPGGAASERFRVVEGEERLARLLLPAGRVTLTAALAPGSPLFEDWRDSLWTVTAIAAVGQAPGDRPVEGLPAANPEVTLAPGRWLVAVQSDRATAAREIEVAPGDAQTLRLDLGAARLLIQAGPEAGAALSPNTVFEVAPLAADGTPGERLVLGGAAEGIGAILPAGTWRIYASDSFDRRAEQQVELRAGDETTVTLTLR